MFATASHDSAASKGWASISQITAMFVNSGRESPATPLRLRKAVSAFDNRQCRAWSRAVSNSARQGESPSRGSSRILVRSAAGTPDEPTIAARSRRSSSLPSPESLSHSTIPWAKPMWPS
jgi:hypothetical protein